MYTQNLSTKGEDITLRRDRDYYVFDALYLGKLKAKIQSLSRDNLDMEIERKVFPYTEAPFAKIKGKDRFKVSYIKKVEDEEANFESKHYFSSDTGLILFVEERLLEAFVSDFEYDKLVDTIKEGINTQYWTEISSNFERDTLALVLTPGIDSGYDFEGSGMYEIIF